MFLGSGLIMKLTIDCVPCMLKTVNLASKLAREDEQSRKEILLNAFSMIISNWDKTPIEVSFELFKMIRRVTGVNDPFKEIKKISNQVASNLYPMMKKLVDISQDKLETAVKLSVAGNAIDIVTVDFSDFEKTLITAFRKGLAINDYHRLRQKASSSKNLLYFLDNAGEIYTDRLLLETLLDFRGREFERITIIVKGGAIVNDATIDDLVLAGLDSLPNVSIIPSSNGEEDTGIHPYDEELNNLIKQHEFIISKGMANYEVLEDRKNIFFLLIAKCSPIAERLNVDINDLVLKYSNRS